MTATGDALLTDQDLLALVECARELSTEVNLVELLQRILSKATELTSSADGSILMHSSRGDGLYFAAVTGPNTFLLETLGEFSDKHVPVEGSIAGQVYVSQLPSIHRELQHDPEHFKAVDRATQQPTTSMITVPLTCGGERLGVMQVRNKPSAEYTPRDLRLATDFGAQAAVAVRNARLFERLLAHMGLFVSRRQGTGPLDMLRELDRPPHAEDVSIMFADLRGFTRLCQTPGSVTRTWQFLNRFVGLLTGRVVAHAGIANKLMGDGLMAMFRGPDHARNAVRCAFDLVEQFSAHREEWLRDFNEYTDYVDIGVGIATDEVTIGTIGDERSVRDFTAIGTAVNLAEVLENGARNGNRIQVDKRTYHAAIDHIAAAEGPIRFVLKRPDQEEGRTYERFVLRQLKAPGAASQDTTDSGTRGHSPSTASTTPTTPAVSSTAASTRGANPGVPPARRGQVFISYSHKDAEWLERLRTHLRPYERTGQLDAWDDRQIRAGQQWLKEIESALAAAKVAVLLVTSNFLASEFITGHEVPRLLNSAAANGLTVVWIAASSSAFRATPLDAYQAANDPAQPLDRMDKGEQEAALAKICEYIHSVMSARA